MAARAPVTVQPGVAGAVLPIALAAEAHALGPIRFEAKYRDTPVLVQAQFLRARPGTEWDVHWFGGVPVSEAARHLAVLSLGVRGVVPGALGATGEAVCLIDTEAKAALQKVAALSPGDAVLVQGEPTTWSAAGPRDPVVLLGCRFAG